MIFCPARSVASAMRAQSDDRRRTRLADHAPGAIAGAVALGGVLPIAAALGGRPRLDAPDRRAAPGAPVCRRADVARSVAAGRLRGWPQACGDADAANGDRGPGPERQYTW